MESSLQCTAQTLHKKMFVEVKKCVRNTGNSFTRPEVSSPASGGIGYFPDEAVNEGGKPWSNDSPTVCTQYIKPVNIPVLRIRDVYPGSDFFPSRILDPHQRI
jgi:hypothetical protein